MHLQVIQIEELKIVPTCRVLYIQSPANVRAPIIGKNTKKIQLILPPQLFGMMYGILSLNTILGGYLQWPEPVSYTAIQLQPLVLLPEAQPCYMTLLTAKTFLLRPQLFYILT